ncbi:MAG TPA: thiamine pyrophosphate-dependent enzyme [Thermoanaerobaculia bacterium]|nr:thiamine pyrophosphate-dependent enzyme [Thermoanaerobaculia bacterium]
MRALATERTGLLGRREALEGILSALGDDDCIVSALGFISRDLFALTGDRRQRCFYCMGSMGSVLPLALGIALAKPRLRIFGLEGDGSLLMNLGGLATAVRYGSANLNLIVFDNRQYESSGGQASQPEGFEIAAVCRAAGLDTRVATCPGEVGAALAAMAGASRQGPAVLVAKVAAGPPQARVSDPPRLIAARFSAYLASRPSN